MYVRLRSALGAGGKKERDLSGCGHAALKEEEVERYNSRVYIRALGAL